MTKEWYRAQRRRERQRLTQSQETTNTKGCSTCLQFTFWCCRRQDSGFFISIPSSFEAYKNKYR